MPPVIPNPEAIREFPDRAGFERWLSENHDTASEIWLKIHKKGSGLPTVTNLQAIEVALCWGWIDAIRKGFDDRSFLQRFTPRGRKSIWSQVNRDHVERLVGEGRMTVHGMRHVEAAKADGRWDRAYGSGSKLETPPELMAAIEAEPAALEMYRRLNSTNRFALAFRVHNLKTAAGRAKRIAAFVEMLARGETIHPNGRAK